MKKFIIKLLSILSKHQFKKHAKVGYGLVTGIRARCINNSTAAQSIVIGNNVTILGTIHTECSGRITIGDFTRIEFNTEIGAALRIEIGKDVIISHDVHIYDNNNHPVPPRDRELLTRSRFAPERNSWWNSRRAEIIIEDNVWIGMFSFIGKGVTIGKGSIVAAHSVVVHDVPSFSVVAGNPAVVVKKLEHE